MKLYYSPTSPYVRKVCVAAAELDMLDRIEYVTTNPWEASQPLLQVNPLSKVPALITDDEQVLFDSPVICEYLNSLHVEQQLIPTEATTRWNTLTLQALADGILDASVLRFMELKRHESQQSENWLDMQAKTVERALNYIEDKVNEWTSIFQLGQISVACALGYLDFRFSEVNWRKSRPALSDWYEVIAQRPSMRTTEPKA